MKQGKAETMKGRVQPSFSVRLKKDLRRNYSLYLLMLPVLAFYLYFHYKPMYGVLIAFKNFSFKKGIIGSEWVGMENFTRFFSDPYFTRNIVNTVKISLASIVFGLISDLIVGTVFCFILRKRIITWLIHCYQHYAPDRVRLKCVFEPSCSEYMLLAVNKYGFFKGLFKGIKRLLRCHPPGGVDYP